MKEIAINDRHRHPSQHITGGRKKKRKKKNERGERGGSTDPTSSPRLKLPRFLSPTTQINGIHAPS